jgi:hypothetical protein
MKTEEQLNDEERLNEYIKVSVLAGKVIHLTTREILIARLARQQERERIVEISKECDTIYELLKKIQGI